MRSPGSFYCYVRTQRRRGAMIIMVALLLPVLLILVGFSVDLAHMQRVRTEMRCVADLSARAAAGELSRTEDMALARAAAKDVANQNLVAGVPLTLRDQDIVFGHSQRQTSGEWTFQAGGTPFNSIRVIVSRTNASADGSVGLFFGHFYNRDAFEPELSATCSFLDVDICLVLDRSSSMKLYNSDTAGFMSTSDSRFCEAPHAESRWVALENAVGLFVNHLTSTQADERVALVTFASNYTSHCGETSSEASIDQPLNSDLSLVNAAMSARTSSVWNGATNVYAGINLGRTVLNGSGSQISSKVMIVLTDGVYTGSDPVPQALLAGEEDITVHTITFSDGADQTSMQNVAVAGHGNHYHAPDADALNDVFTKIAGSLAVLTQ